jgi:hypothetical protein
MQGSMLRPRWGGDARIERLLLKHMHWHDPDGPFQGRFSDESMEPSSLLERTLEIRTGPTGSRLSVGAATMVAR